MLPEPFGWEFVSFMQLHQTPITNYRGPHKEHRRVCCLTSVLRCWLCTERHQLQRDRGEAHVRAMFYPPYTQLTVLNIITFLFGACNQVRQTINYKDVKKKDERQGMKNCKAFDVRMEIGNITRQRKQIGICGPLMGLLCYWGRKGRWCGNATVRTGSTSNPNLSPSLSLCIIFKAMSSQKHKFIYLSRTGEST